ncbi:xanthine dehydrogenase family protein molybdopterin-binding subunit [Candidatus Poribacteria bacterium]|nr:xanthine dehydrogenase family protein molybdopterin-binding subunit [Candidatus Poribacteria bacterium]MYI94213.1 xanthine dehydrogenase family protein molybdopterin-binding subunit [Candidatus Poribacteria bacterium]
MSEKKEYKVIGTRPIRHDGVDKVTGRAIYGADFHITGLLHGRVLRSPHAHARIISIDTSRAEALPGVKGVVTAQNLPAAEDKIADLGEGAVNLKYLCDNILASDKALYKGHAIAAVAATNPHIAEEACTLIDVEYEVLPPVLEVRKAMEPDAPILHENLTTSSLGDEDDRPTNIASHLQHKKGDIEKGFAEADVVIERDFVTGTVHQGYIEPHNATAHYNQDGQLTVWCSTQGAFTVREQLAEILQYPISKIKVVPLEIGGGFGGKINVYIKPVAALLAKKTGKPVKVLMNRADVFEGTGPTPASYITIKIGAKEDGKITAAQTSLAFEAGAYPGSPVGAGAMCVFAPYNIEHVLIDGYDVVVNKPKTAPYRAPGATNAAFGTETVIDELAEQLNIDPLEIRIMNGAKEGDRRADGPIFPRIGFIESVEAAKEHPHYTAPNGKKYHGRGVASGFWFNIGLESSVTINVNPDGTVNLVEGSTDIGGTRASIAMQAAEVLGIPAESVNPTVVDTNSIGYTAVTGGSRTTYATGYAAYEAAQDVVKQMIGRAAKLWDVDEANVQFADGEFSSINGKEEQISFRDLSARLGGTGGPVVGRATMNPAGAGGAFATHVVDVAVDEDTGKVEILRYTATQDAGKAIHPSYVEGQIQGGVVQGIGWALNEEYIYNEEGAMTNASFLDYRMPTCLDLPMIDTVIVEVPNPGHPYGVRGVGEVPIIPPPAAIANAIYDAIGIRMTELPMSPDRLLKAMGKI